MSNQLTSEIVVAYFAFYINVKWFHFSTPSYAAHKASDELFQYLGGAMDTLFEVYKGKKGYLPNVEGNSNDIRLLQLTNNDAMKDYTKTFELMLQKICAHISQVDDNNMNGDVCNIIDETRAHLNQFIYLLSLK